MAMFCAIVLLAGWCAAQGEPVPEQPQIPPNSRSQPSSQSPQAQPGAKIGLEQPVLGQLQQELTDIVRRVRPVVVTVIASYPPRVENGVRIESKSFASSGIVFDETGHILTPAEPLDDGALITVYNSLVSGERQQFRARCVGQDPMLNIAVVKVLFPSEELQPFTPGDPASLELGSIVLALGCPYQFPTSCSWGMVSGLNREIDSGKKRNAGLIMTTAAVNPGDAGGALVNVQGQVVGMLMSTFGRSGSDREKKAGTADGNELIREAPTINFVLPIDRVVAQARDILKTGGDLEPPEKKIWKFLGVRGHYLLEPNPISTQLNLPPKAGFVVYEIFEGEPAKLGGIQVHDVILRLGEVDIADSGWALMRGIQEAPRDQDVPVVVVRKGRRMTVTVRFQ
jgi:S1-C subfamily serine protease